MTDQKSDKATTYTPGPWTAKSDEMGRNYQGWFVELSFRSASDNPGWYETGEGQLIEADARLIAAAPELYDALRGLSKGTAHPDDPALVGDAPCWCDPRSMFAQGPHDDACLAARAALEKASLIGNRVSTNG